MMKNQEINERIFYELKEISELNFEYEEESDPLYNVMHLSRKMQLYPTNMINTTEITYEYNPDILGKSNHYFKTLPLDWGCLNVS